MTNIKKLLKLFAIGYTLLMLSLPALHARSATPVDVPINSLDAGAIVKDWVILGPFPNEEIEKAFPGNFWGQEGAKWMRDRTEAPEDDN